MTDLAQLRKAATSALRQMNNLDQPIRWRQIATDTELETGVALVCTAEGVDDQHPAFELEAGTGRDEEGVYDCCPQPWIETGSVIVAAYMVAALNADAEGEGTR